MDVPGRVLAVIDDGEVQLTLHNGQIYLYVNVDDINCVAHRLDRSDVGRLAEGSLVAMKEMS